MESDCKYTAHLQEMTIKAFSEWSDEELKLAVLHCLQTDVCTRVVRSKFSRQPLTSLENAVKTEEGYEPVPLVEVSQGLYKTRADALSNCKSPRDRRPLRSGCYCCARFGRRAESC